MRVLTEHNLVRRFYRELLDNKVTEVFKHQILLVCRHGLMILVSIKVGRRLANLLPIEIFWTKFPTNQDSVFPQS